MCQRTVLIVEDEPVIRMVLADTLLDIGCDVIEAGNVLEAVAVLGQRTIDAVVTDVDMPGGLSGVDLARMISSMQMDVPVIVASGGHSLRSEDLPHGALFIPKPYEMEIIATLVADLTSGAGRRLAG